MREATASILLVDDAPTNLLALEAALGGMDLDLVKAASGAEALRHCLAQDFAIILLDIRMPGMDGFEVAELLRRRERTRLTPIIFLTAASPDTADEQIFQGYTVGAVDYITKPFAPAILRAKVAVFVDLFQKTSELRWLTDDLEDRVAQRTRELETTAARLQTVNELARSVGASLDLTSILNLIVGQLPSLTGCVVCFVAEHRPSEGNFEVRASRRTDGAEPTPMGLVLGVADTATGAAFASGAPYTVQDGRESPLAGLRRLANQGVCSIAAVPIFVESAVWGTLTVGFGPANAVTADRLVFLDAVCSHLGVAVRNARLHGQLRESYEDLRRTQAQIVQQERLRALGEMASGVAHDFNNALAPILGFSELLLDHPADLDDRAKVLQYLQIIRSGADDAGRVVSRLREFYRPHEPDEGFSAVDLSRVARETISLTQPRWRDQPHALGQTVEVRADLGQVPPVAGDAAQLREALINLIFNAVDALPDGGTITIQTRVEGSEVVLEVADTGVGMTEEQQHRCLEPFFTTKGEHGSGLGLPQVYGIVQRHQGRLDIASQMGAGTTITLRFPASASIDAAQEQANGSHPRSLHVLVVDDNPGIRDAMIAALAGDGHIVQTAEDGQDGIERFRAGAFDIVITDRGMPRMNGDRLAAAIKQVSPRTPVILLTGVGSLMGSEDMPLGVDLVVGKPVKLAALRQALVKVVPAEEPSPGEPAAGRPPRRRQHRK